jgi:3-oxoacyl-[acyl-carrier-protein] synthase II
VAGRTVKRRAVVTGIGMVTPLGPDLSRTRAALETGGCALRPVSRFDVSAFASKSAAEVRDFDARPHFRIPKALKLTDLRTRFAVAAASMALADAGAGSGGNGLDRSRLGVLIGSSGSDLQAEELAHAVRQDFPGRCATDIPFFAERILSGLNPLWLLVNLPNMVSAHVAIQIESNGPNSTVMTDWVAGTQALGEAFHWILGGEADAVLAGGADNGVLPFVFATYERAGLFEGEAGPRPSFVLGEGAAMILLEERDHARARGARIYGEILSYATSGVPVEELSDGVEQTAALALARAGKASGDVEAICCASVFADPYWEAERTGLARAVPPGGKPARLLEFKSRIGHTLAASGPIELGVAIPDFGSLSAGGVVLFNSVGYMGQTAALVVGREEAA